MKKRYLLGTTAIILLPLATQAAETVTYTYDAKGRLVKVVHSGTINSNVQVQYAYDKADNRQNVTTTGSPNGTPPPPPPPPPPSSNNPPVANVDNAGSMTKCNFKTVNVTANDTDPEGNYPLVVISAAGGADIDATVASSNSVRLESFAVTGTKTATYVVADSLGATSTGTVTVNVTGGACN